MHFGGGAKGEHGKLLLPPEWVGYDQMLAGVHELWCDSTNGAGGEQQQEGRGGNDSEATQPRDQATAEPTYVQEVMVLCCTEVLDNLGL